MVTFDTPSPNGGCTLKPVVGAAIFWPIEWPEATALRRTARGTADPKSASQDVVLNLNSTCPAALACTRLLACAGRVM
jgi:hypothetical protein